MIWTTRRQEPDKRDEHRTEIKTWIEQTWPHGLDCFRNGPEPEADEIIKEVLAKFRAEVEKRFMRTRHAESRSQIMNEILQEIGL